MILFIEYSKHIRIYHMDCYDARCSQQSKHEQSKHVLHLFNSLTGKYEFRIDRTNPFYGLYEMCTL